MGFESSPRTKNDVSLNQVQMESANQMVCAPDEKRPEKLLSTMFVDRVGTSTSYMSGFSASCHDADALRKRGTAVTT
jgi:hypothetical protein